MDPGWDRSKCTPGSLNRVSIPGIGFESGVAGGLKDEEGRGQTMIAEELRKMDN